MTIAEKIAAAMEWVKNNSDDFDPQNDAANIYADNFREYETILTAITK